MWQVSSRSLSTTCILSKYGQLGAANDLKLCSKPEGGLSGQPTLFRKHIDHIVCPVSAGLDRVKPVSVFGFYNNNRTDARCRRQTWAMAAVLDPPPTLDVPRLQTCRNRAATSSAAVSACSSGHDMPAHYCASFHGNSSSRQCIAATVYCLQNHCAQLRLPQQKAAGPM